MANTSRSPSNMPDIVSDNLKPGQELEVSGGLIMLFFGEELMDALRAHEQQQPKSDRPE